MKFQLSTKSFSEALQHVSRAVPPKSVMPALEGILLKAQPGIVQLTGYDLEMGIETQLEADVTEPGSIVLSAKLLVDIIRRLPDDKVYLSSDDKNLTTISSGRSEYTILGLSPLEYPDLPEVDGVTALSFSQHLLKGMIEQTRYAIASSDTMPVHKGSLFSIENGTFDLVSVDGCRLALRTEAYSTDEPVRFIVPGKTLSDLSKMLSDDGKSEEEQPEPVQVFVAPKHIVFSVGPYKVISRLLEGNFLDYQNAIPKTSKTTVTMTARAVTEAVERASLIIDDKLKNPIKCSFADGQLTVTSTTSMGRATDVIDCAMEGEPVEIGFNSSFLLEALKNADCDEITFQLSGPLSPMKVMPSHGDYFTFLVLPVRIRS